MNVPADAVVIAAHHQRRLAVGLEADDPVDDVDAGFLEHAGLVDVVFLVEPGLKLDERGHLLLVFGGTRQRRDDRVGLGRAVQGDLDGQHLGIFRRLLDELDDRAERLVGMVNQQVLVADGREDALALGQRGGHLGLERGLLEVAKPLELAESQKGRQVDRAGDLVDVAILELECRGREQLDQKVFVGALRDLQPHGRPPLALAEGFLDRRQQAASDLVFLDGQIAVARDAKRDALGGPVAAEEGVEPGADHVFEQDEPPLAVGFVGQRDQPAEHRRHLEDGVARALVRLVRLDPHEQVQALVVHVRKRMRRVDGQRGQDGVDLGVEIIVEEGGLAGASAPAGVHRRMPCLSKSGHRSR